MAKAVVDNVVVVQPWRTWARTVAIGAGTGLAFWLLTILLNRYIIEPWACRQIVNATFCVGSNAIAGNIAAVLAGVIALVVMIRLRVVLPIVITVMSAALLWDLAAWTAGLVPYEVLLWSVGLYAVSFGLFGWITRYSRLWVIISLSVLIVLIVRIAILL